MQQQAIKAKNEPSFENTWRRLHLNQWVANETKWISDEKWMLCDGEVDINYLRGKVCYAGLDLASTRDITCLALLFPDDEGCYDIINYNFIPEENAKKRSERDKVNYDKWYRENYVIYTPGDVTDYNYIKQKIVELSELYDIQIVAYDRWNSSQLIIDLTEDGCPCIPVGQGFKTMSPATKEFETLILSGKIRHNGDPVLRWMMSNVVLTFDPAGNVKPNKAKSNEKIDGIVACIMALSEAMENKNKGGSAYDDKEIFFI